MKALVRKKYGDPDSVLWMDLPEPTPGPTDVLIRVHCTCISRTDCGILQGTPYIFRFFTGWPKPRLQTLGSDFAGVVVAVGEKVKRYRPGEKVFGFKDDGLGSQAEYLVLPEDGPMEHIPGQHTYREALSAAEGAHYALNMIGKLKLEKGSKMLVIGATGAIGSAAIQILRARGIRIDAVGPENYRDYWQERGVESYFAFENQDFRKAKKKYSHIIDAVGKSNFFQCKRLLLAHGAYVSSELGPLASNIWLSWFAFFMSHGKVHFPVPKNIPGSLKEMHKLLGADKYEGLIDPTKVGPRQAKDAYRYACSGEKIGNLIMDWYED